MKATEVLEHAMKFKEDFLDQYPAVEDGSALLFEFAGALQEYKQAGYESDELDELLALANDSDLRTYADANFDLGTLQDTMRSDEEQQGNHNGDEETMSPINYDTAGDAAGIAESAHKIVDDLRKVVDEFILTLQ